MMSLINELVMSQKKQLASNLLTRISCRGGCLKSLAYELSTAVYKILVSANAVLVLSPDVHIILWIDAAAGTLSVDAAVKSRFAAT